MERLWIGDRMEKLISIIGQTSSGKSDLAIFLAKKFNGEIVSADSRQVYRGLDWCSGKVSKAEQAEVRHHLIDVASLGEQFSLYDYQKMAYSLIDDIAGRGKLPFLVGGTGLYSRAVVEGYNLSESSPNETLRKSLEGLDLDSLVAMCKQRGIEPPAEYTARRLIRLLETNAQKSENEPRYEVLQIGILWDREKIYERIKKRLELRLPNMIEEIKNLLDSGVDPKFLCGLGLEAKYVTKYVLGEFSDYGEFFEELFKEERHFAKRQQTWYKKEKNTIWLNGDDELYEKSAKIIEKFLKNSEK